MSGEVSGEFSLWVSGEVSGEFQGPVRSGEVR